MRVNNIEINAELSEVLERLQEQLRLSNSQYLQKKPRRSGDYLIIQCPYHKNGQENHPSAQLRESDGLFWCFNCGITHSLPEVIDYCLGTNGMDWLLNNFNSADISERKIKFNIERGKKEQKPTIKYITSEQYQQFRRTHPYMFERKLNMDIIRKYDIGYDEDFILDIKDDKGKIINQKHVGGCITFPNKDINGNILFIARRSVNTKFFHYPENVDKPVYGLYEILRAIKKGEKISSVYVCESMLDALYICTMGKWAIALNGTGSSKQFEILRNIDFIRIFILATDNDKAGKFAREKFRKNVTNKIIQEIDYESYGKCKDINDMTEEQFLNAKILSGFLSKK